MITNWSYNIQNTQVSRVILFLTYC